MSVPVTAPTTTSIDFPDSRFVVMRDSWDPRSYYMIVNYGDWQNHCHFDQLDFEIYANGVPIALDAGLGPLGYLDTLQVSWYKHPLSHNMVTINRAVPEKMDKPGYDKHWSVLKQSIFFAATHDGYVRYQKARHRRHIVYSKARYWLVIDEVQTTGSRQEMDFNLHTPCSMKETDDGYISIQENGFLIKQDHQDAHATQRVLSRGGADLTDLRGESSNREIDWLIFRKVLAGDRRVDRMATLIYPFASQTSCDPADVSVARLAMKDTAAIGYRVRTKNRKTSSLCLTARTGNSRTRSKATSRTAYSALPAAALTTRESRAPHGTKSMEWGKRHSTDEWIGNTRNEDLHGPAASRPLLSHVSA